VVHYTPGHANQIELFSILQRKLLRSAGSPRGTSLIDKRLAFISDYDQMA